ncbi:hypothetical protein HAX54_006849 [Datura stramonium]|uniref:Uncharacterized protein n=1 Tax=Datura stramonium TaxID=4076 RepID=A0ABS8WZ23_DATST|nr:hypothetical protein [Datura stramonium]
MCILHVSASHLYSADGVLRPTDKVERIQVECIWGTVSLEDLNTTCLDLHSAEQYLRHLIARQCFNFKHSGFEELVDDINPTDVEQPKGNPSVESENSEGEDSEMGDAAYAPIDDNTD